MSRKHRMLTKQELWERGHISDDDYRNWQDAFPLEYEVAESEQGKKQPAILTIGSRPSRLF